MFFKKSFWTGKNIVFIILATVLLLIFPKIIGIAMLFFASYIIACALNPFVTKLSKKMSRPAASSVVMLASFLSVIALLVPIFVVAVKEIRVFMLSFPNKIYELTNFISTGKFYGHRINELFDINSLISNSPLFAQDLFSKSVNITVGLAQFVIIIITMTMIVYYIVSDKDYLKKKFIQVFPPDMKQKANDILATISYKVGYYVRAQLLSMAAVGLMVMIVLALLGVEYATLLGLISGLLDIIPILGPSIALIIILLVACPTAIVKVILLITGFLLCQQISNYVIKPILFGKLMQMHPLTIFLALFLANQFLGFWGVILSPALAATVCVLIDELYIKPINIKGIDIDK